MLPTGRYGYPSRIWPTMYTTTSDAVSARLHGGIGTPTRPRSAHRRSEDHHVSSTWSPTSPVANSGAGPRGGGAGAIARRRPAGAERHSAGFRTGWDCACSCPERYPTGSTDPDPRDLSDPAGDRDRSVTGQCAGPAASSGGTSGDQLPGCRRHYEQAAFVLPRYRPQRAFPHFLFQPPERQWYGERSVGDGRMDPVRVGLAARHLRDGHDVLSVRPALRSRQ